MASSLFMGYNFITGKLTVFKEERLNVLLPVGAKDNEIILLIKQCSIYGANGCESVIVPSNNEIRLAAGKRKTFKFEFPESEISGYNVGATISVEIWDQSEKLPIMVCYTYGDTNSGWVITSVSPVDEPSRIFNEEDTWDVLIEGEDLDSEKNTIVYLYELEFPVRIYYCLKRAGFDTLNDITKLTLDELSKVKGMRPDALMQVLTALRNHHMWLAKEHTDSDVGEIIEEKKADDTEASADEKMEKITITTASKIKPGYRIIHEKFGEGLVISVTCQLQA